MTTLHLYQDKNEATVNSAAEAEEWITSLNDRPLTEAAKTTIQEIFALSASAPLQNTYTRKVCRYSNSQGEVIDLPDGDKIPTGYLILGVIYPCALNGEAGTLANLYPYSFVNRMKIRFVKQ